MKVKDLIKKLEEMPQEMEVAIFDWRKNLFNGGGDSVSDGIESVKDIEIVPDAETVKLMREDGEEINQWVSISYENDDYTEDAQPDELTAIGCYFEEKYLKAESK